MVVALRRSWNRFHCKWAGPGSELASERRLTGRKWNKLLLSYRRRPVRYHWGDQQGIPKEVARAPVSRFALAVEFCAHASPDKNPGVKNIQEWFARLGVISQILRSPERRERYNVSDSVDFHGVDTDQHGSTCPFWAAACRPSTRGNGLCTPAHPSSSSKTVSPLGAGQATTTPDSVRPSRTRSHSSYCLHRSSTCWSCT